MQFWSAEHPNAANGHAEVLAGLSFSPASTANQTNQLGANIHSSQLRYLGGLLVGSCVLAIRVVLNYIHCLRGRSHLGCSASQRFLC
ncbi:hypothetical protein BKA82DRAFT_815428 [Pisolithus tinctorius]|nr:hypothetical protein BKA82DRAFT_815428 [Pisolithus tinctorius]